MFEFKDLQFMGDNVKNKLKFCGSGVKILPCAKIVPPQYVEIGDFCRICDFAMIYAGKGVKIGNHCDIQPHVTVWGGGELVIGDYVSIGCGSTLLTAVYSHAKGLKMVDGLQADEAKALYGKLTIGDNVYIGAGSTLMPNITIGEGCIIGAGSFVNKNCEPWGIYVGAPARKIGERER